MIAVGPSGPVTKHRSLAGSRKRPHTEKRERRERNRICDEPFFGKALIAVRPRRNRSRPGTTRRRDGTIRRGNPSLGIGLRGRVGSPAQSSSHVASATLARTRLVTNGAFGIYGQDVNHERVGEPELDRLLREQEQ